MSSGDKKRQQNILNEETARTQQGLDRINNTLYPQNQQFMGNYNRATDSAFGDYGDIMNRYRGYMDDPENFKFDRVNAERIDPHTISYSRSPELAEAMRGYSEFSKTGGFDENARRDIRARGTSPIRAAYGNTMRQLDRARALGGDGGATNYVAAVSRAQRELPQQLADAQQAVESDLAQKIQSGRLAGLGGLSETSIADTGFGQQAQLANQEAIMRSRLSNQDVSLRAALANQAAGQNNGKLAALAGMTNLYGTTPGMANMFGQQVLNSNNQLMSANQLQQQAGQSRLAGQQQVNQMPGTWSKIGNIAKIAGAAAATYFSGGAAAPLLGAALKGGISGGGGKIPYLPTQGLNKSPQWYTGNLGGR